MSDIQFPYDLPIWRSSFSADSPDGKLIAKIDEAYETSMGNPTTGTLEISNGIKIESCNPSFIWSDDSRYLAVPQHQYGWIRRKKQRLLIVDVQKRLSYASQSRAWYFQPESFRQGHLKCVLNPSNEALEVSWAFPDQVLEFLKPEKV